MLPVSGAEQLKISDAHEIRPMISAQRRVFQIGDAGAMIAGQEQVPEPLGAGETFQLLQDRRPMVAMPVLDLLLIESFNGMDVPLHEDRQSSLQLDRPRTVLKIHRPGLPFFGVSKTVPVWRIVVFRSSRLVSSTVTAISA